LDAGDGPAVVLLHGLGATNRSMLPILWNLARDHRVLAPDLPGFGASGKPVRSYHPAFYAAWLKSFLDEVGVKRASVVGNSLGGRIALEAGLAMPGRIDRLVLLTPGVAFIRGRQYAPLVKLLRPEMALLPVVLTHWEVVRLARSLFAEPDRLPGEWYDSFANEFLRVWQSPRARIAFFSAARQIYLDEPGGDSGFWQRIRGLRPPALFIWGDRDWLIPAKFARHVGRALPNAQSIVLEDCGHVPQYELPARTNQLVRRFLDADTRMRRLIARSA
jgi:pimeloyl-ACP methyl ester carboxylesterase